MGKKLLLPLQLDDNVKEDEVGSEIRMRFNDVVSKGVTSSSESVSFPILLSCTPVVGERSRETGFSVRSPVSISGRGDI